MTKSFTGADNQKVDLSTLEFTYKFWKWLQSGAVLTEMCYVSDSHWTGLEIN